MDKIKRILKFAAGIVPAMALFVGVSSASQCCVWWFHQPRVPEKIYIKR